MEGITKKYQCVKCKVEINFDSGSYCVKCRHFCYKNDKLHYQSRERYVPWTEEEIKMWHEKYGRGWWIFDNQPNSAYIAPAWIEQYKVLDPDTMASIEERKKVGRPKKEKMYEYQDKGDLVCTICTNGKPQSEPMQDDDIYIAMCSGCKDWGEFKYKNELED